LECKKKHPKGNTDIIFIPFVKEGTTSIPTSNAKKQGILQQASEWTLQADLDKKLQFTDIVQTSWEERCHSAYELKTDKYTDLQTLCKERGWQTWLSTVEVGCRGFPTQSVWTTLSSLGSIGRQRRAALKALGQSAERAISWLWLKRDQENWKLSNDG